MKGLLNEIGLLSIQRGKKKQSRDQFCKKEEGTGCGDWCPLFDEPIEVPLIHEKDSFRTLLQICQSRTLSFTELIDMRE